MKYMLKDLIATQEEIDWWKAEKESRLFRAVTFRRKERERLKRGTLAARVLKIELRLAELGILE